MSGLSGVSGSGLREASGEGLAVSQPDIQPCLAQSPTHNHFFCNQSMLRQSQLLTMLMTDGTGGMGWPGGGRSWALGGGQREGDD